MVVTRVLAPPFFRVPDIRLCPQASPSPRFVLRPNFHGVQPRPYCIGPSSEMRREALLCALDQLKVLPRPDFSRELPKNPGYAVGDFLKLCGNYTEMMWKYVMTF